MSNFLSFAAEIVAWNCSALSVPAPTIRIADASSFATPTVKCAVSNDGKELLINKTFADGNPDETSLWLAISHECRHVWQASQADMFGGYASSSDMETVAYNSQPAEIDAWAWTVIVLANKLGVRPTLEKNLGADLWAKIQARARQIVAEKLY